MSTEEITSSIPTLHVQPVTGWRAWRISRTVFYRDIKGKSKYILRSAAVHSLWIADQHGACDAGAEPKLHSSYGFYSCLKKRDALISFLCYTDACVWGEIECWGRIIRHENGYRSEFARPKRLWVAHGPYYQRKEIAKHLASYYHCKAKATLLPVRVHKSLAIMRLVGISTFIPLIMVVFVVVQFIIMFTFKIGNYEYIFDVIWILLISYIWIDIFRSRRKRRR